MDARKQEALLKAWMRMTVCIRGNRILGDMSMNEMLICNLLFQQEQSGDEWVTASTLCDQLRLLKSQINKILSEMENKQLIERVRSGKDKRKVYIHLKKDSIPLYMKEHDRVMQVIDVVAGQMGLEKTETLTTLINEAIDIVDDFQREEIK